MMGIRMSTVRPYKPVLTESNLQKQAGKVFIVTGASSGLGFELTKILYQHDATVYLAARSESKATEAIRKIEQAHPSSNGKLVFLRLELDDLSTIKRSAQEFLAKESRLDVLWLNAGVMVPPQGSKTKQGHELQFGVNNLGHYLFVTLLRDILESTAKIAPKASVRVIWVSSSAADNAPKPALDFDNMDYHRDEGPWTKYARSKAGGVIHSAEFVRRTEGTGIISLALNPGNFITNLQDNMPRWQLALFKRFAYNPVNGAYTELYAGLDTSITEKDNGGWVSPFGKFEKNREDFLDKDLGQKFWEWSEEQIGPYR